MGHLLGNAFEVIDGLLRAVSVGAIPNCAGARAAKYGREFARLQKQLSQENTRSVLETEESESLRKQTAFIYWEAA